MDARTAKRLLREEIWRELEAKGVARFPLPCHGRIPNFRGSDEAADRLRASAEWIRASVVFVSPDFAQRKVRENTLSDGKILVMVSPRLRHGYVMVHPDDAKGSTVSASTIKGAFNLGKIMGNEEIPRPDLVIEGAVAVDTQGNRLGKGGGYGDAEIKTLKTRFGSIPVAVTVHDLQVVKAVPFEDKDEKIQIIVTPTRLIRLTN
ncbi:MAG: 5-formyltetrahydrofolate cyclo-ligase [Candidatus Bathyarchaeia archaeon]